MIINPKKKLFQIIIITFSITSILYIISIKKNKKKQEIKLRKNEYTNSINYICSHSNDDLLPLYENMRRDINLFLFLIDN